MDGTQNTLRTLLRVYRWPGEKTGEEHVRADGSQMTADWLVQKDLQTTGQLEYVKGQGR